MFRVSVKSYNHLEPCSGTQEAYGWFLSTLIKYSVEATASKYIPRRSDFSTRKPHDEEDLAKASGAQDPESSRTCSRVSGALVWVLVFVVQGLES